MRKHAAVLVLILDAALLAGWWWAIPLLRRPLDVLSVGVCVMGVLSILVVKRKWIQNAFLLAVVVFAAIFALEMTEKYFRFVGTMQQEQSDARQTASEESYAWPIHGSRQYVLAREKAIRDGYLPADVLDHFAGDVFAGRDDIWKLEMHPHAVDYTVLVQALKPEHKKGVPLGFEANPDNLVRRYFYTNGDPRTTLIDGLRTTDSAGGRPTRGNPDSADTYIFLGCSVFMGFGLNDDQTTPYYFSRESGFSLRVLNFAYNNTGPHQALADLETDHHAARAGVDPGSVRGVIFSYLGEGHDNRVVRGDPIEEPCYGFFEDTVRYRGTFRNADFMGRILMIASRSRIYMRAAAQLPPWLRFVEYKRRLSLAILRKMHEVCLDKYGVPLTVFCFANEPDAEQRLRDEGIRVHAIRDVPGLNWEGENRMRSQLFDGHPSAYANELIGKYLYMHEVEARTEVLQNSD